MFCQKPQQRHHSEPKPGWRSGRDFSFFAAVGAFPTRFLAPALTILAIIIFADARLRADVVNGSFELSDSNEGLGFDPPTAWVRLNYAAVTSNFIPDPAPNQGHTDFWKIDPNIGLFPIDANRFVVLSTGDWQPEPVRAKISQQVELLEGQRICGFYFFGTADYIPYPDIATIKLLGDSNLMMPDIELVDINVADVGDYSSMDAWGRFAQYIDQNSAGTYELVLEVRDEGDDVYESYLAADGIRVCDVGPYGDINFDCDVNMVDLAIMAVDWGQDCSDPGYAEGPGNNCRLGTDLNGDGPIDIWDLSLLCENWLSGS